MNSEELKAMAKNDIPELSKKLSENDIPFLVKSLNEKDNETRYKAFLLLQGNSVVSPFVYEFWDELQKKLESSNSYQRSIGAMLIAENVRWDNKNKFHRALSKYLICCNDGKFITARQAIQGLRKITAASDKFILDVEKGLANLQLSMYKDNQQRLLQKDITSVLQDIAKKRNSAE